MTALLTLRGVHTHIGAYHILHGVDLEVPEGQVTTLLGRNGAGKSTTMKALMGLLRPTAGRVRLAGADIAGWEPHRIARAGLGWVPEERRVFPELTVAENLEVGRRAPQDGRAPWTTERIFALFPNLADLRQRPGARISGGEQQMVAIARTLMGNPRVLLLDEPGEGLAPVIVDLMAEAILALKREGATVLLAEQSLAFASRVADRAVILETGRIVWDGAIDALLADTGARARHLQV